VCSASFTWVAVLVKDGKRQLVLLDKSDICPISAWNRAVGSPRLHPYHKLSTLRSVPYFPHVSSLLAVRTKSNAKYYFNFLILFCFNLFGPEKTFEVSKSMPTSHTPPHTYTHTHTHTHTHTKTELGFLLILNRLDFSGASSSYCLSSTKQQRPHPQDHFSTICSEAKSIVVIPQRLWYSYFRGLTGWRKEEPSGSEMAAWIWFYSQSSESFLPLQEGISRPILRISAFPKMRDYVKLYLEKRDLVFL
jgi:hypothetical protein